MLVTSGVFCSPVSAAVIGIHVRLLFGLLLVELVLLPVQGLACLLLFTGSAWEGRAQDLLGLSVCKVLRQLLVHHSGLLSPVWQ